MAICFKGNYGHIAISGVYLSVNTNSNNFFQIQNLKMAFLNFMSNRLRKCGTLLFF